ncbi:hypothetical protein ACFY3V_28135 [Streptosporangium sp. NPDC000095]
MRVRANTLSTAEYANRRRQREEAEDEEAASWESAHDLERFNSENW